ncbi:transposable element Tcb2 transposase [Trichonephila clavipes]|uniref:Transposable element Tcb2 transposase n=1 Tax=Trichonephila clavipes TaxID=2585209 RepID=A0A8X6V0I2_TRICX|nr:transposable element Tcb2 transposase [Trichonephila clavipes]
MIEAGWSAQRVPRQVDRSDLTVRRNWGQKSEKTSFIRQPGSGRSQLTSRREDRHIIRHARVEPTASLATVQIQVNFISCIMGIGQKLLTTFPFSNFVQRGFSAVKASSQKRKKETD